MTHETLLPCPFCGGAASSGGYQRWSRALDDTRWADGTRIKEAYFCNCPMCGVTNCNGSIGYQTAAEAIAAWNRRAAPAADNWRDDPAADERWCAGNEFALNRLCAVLKVDPDTVDWDGSDGSLQEEADALIWRILHANPDAGPPADDLRAVAPKTLTAAQLADACMSYRHDYGLMDAEAREGMRREAAEWWRCFEKTLNDPPAHIRAALRDARGGA